MRYLAFLSNLTRLAHVWFTSLPKSSIENFKQLTERFRHNFCFGVKPPKKTTHLLYVKQGKNEGFREYIARFNKENLEVENYE